MRGGRPDEREAVGAMSATDVGPTGVEPRAKRDPSATLVLRMIALGAGILLLVVAVNQLLELGTRGVDQPSVADYRAVAKADGRPAPAFVLPAVEGGGAIELQAFRGKVVVLNFWASWCAPCRREAPHLQSAWTAYRDRGVQFLGVDILDDRAAARAFVSEFGITYPSAFDPEGSLADDYELLGLPTTVVIDPEGRMAYRFTGHLDGAVLRGTLDELSRGTAA